MQLQLPLEDATLPAGAAPEAPSRPSAPPSSPPIDGLVFVRHPRARRYVLRVDGHGRVRVTIPRGGSRREAGEFAARHRDWIARERLRRLQTPTPRDMRPEMRARAAAELVPRLHELATRFGLTVSRVSIRNQRTRWGSCNRDGHICLNWRLVLMPAWVRDYVLVHELMHLRRMDHSPAYWRLVAAACPEYRSARTWLRQHGDELR